VKGSEAIMHCGQSTHGWSEL